MALSKRDLSIKVNWQAAPAAEEITHYNCDYFTTDEFGIDSPVSSLTFQDNASHSYSSIVLLQTTADTISIRIAACNANECQDINQVAYQTEALLRGPDVPSAVLGIILEQIKS